MYRYEIIYVYKTPLIKHKMLLLPSGWVIHNYPIKGIQIEPLNAAVKGREVFHDSYINSNMSVNELCRKAKEMSLNRKYWLKYNCEHFLNELFGKPIQSKQLCFALTASIAAISLLALVRNRSFI